LAADPDLSGLSVPEETRKPGVVATIGAFDGVHRGHQWLLGQVGARAQALGLASMAVTFDPDPALVLYPDRGFTMLSDRAEKEALIRRQGIDVVLVFEFTRELSLLEPEDFIALLEADHQLDELWVGSDFAMGRDRSGTISALVRIGAAAGFALHVVPPLRAHTQTVSSTRIRALLASGDVRGTAALLGHRYALSGEVIQGFQRGRTIDFPTANLKIPSTRAVPPDGVYAVIVRVADRLWPGVANLGGRPTFDDHERLIEAHLLDFRGDLYGQQISVEFVERLRTVQKFGSIDELRQQIARDAAAARALPELQLLANVSDE
jgi:riboflavin kinase / FMN adenylyltransferase